MSFALFSRSPACFYCGVRSNQSSTVRQFRCQHCEAVNYFDPNGQITDPPHQSTPGTAKAVRYGHAAVLTSPPAESLEGLFCRKCLQNQFLLKENLSNYLPPDDDPQYEKYIASYKSYRENLEQRYPQVCPECAPKVEDRIKTSAYVARSDHLGRMSKRTKQNPVHKRRDHFLAWAVIVSGGIVWALSALGQACWHAFIALSIPVHGSRHNSDEYINTDNSLEIHLGVCLYRTLLQWKVSFACIAILTQAMPVILLSGFMTLWWNNWLWRRYSKPGVTMMKVTEYYTLQGLLFTVRIIGWKLFHPSIVWGNEQSLKGAHLFIALLILTVYPISLHVIRIDRKAQLAPSLSTNIIPPDIASKSRHPTTPYCSRPSDSKQPFPFHKLSTPTITSTSGQLQRQSLSRSSSSSSSSSSIPMKDDYGDPDAMDWTPSAKRPITSFTPTFRTSDVTNTVVFTGLSPFRGTLPPAPVAPAHALRRVPPSTASPFRRATNAQKNSLSASISQEAHLKQRRLSYYGQTPGDLYDSDTTAVETEDEERESDPTRKRRNEIQMAAPKFWPAADLDRKTGLEDIFEEAFTIKDSPLMGGRVVSTPTSIKRGNCDGFMEGTNARSYDHAITAKEHGTTTAGDSGALLLIGIVSVSVLGFSIIMVKGGWI